MRQTLTRRDLIALIVVLLCAATLRLAAPGVVEFKNDEANLSSLALDVVHGRTFRSWASIRQSGSTIRPPRST